MAKISLSEYNKYSSSPILTVEPPNGGNKTLSPDFKEVGMISPVAGWATPGPAAITVASFNFSTFFSGMKIPEAV